MRKLDILYQLCVVCSLVVSLYSLFPYVFRVGDCRCYFGSISRLTVGVSAAQLFPVSYVIFLLASTASVTSLSTLLDSLIRNFSVMYSR